MEGDSDGGRDTDSASAARASSVVRSPGRVRRMKWRRICIWTLRVRGAAMQEWKKGLESAGSERVREKAERRRGNA